MQQKEDLIACRLNQYPSGKEDKLLFWEDNNTGGPSTVIIWWK